MLSDRKIKVKSIINLINIMVLLYYTTGLDLLYKANLGWINSGLKPLVYIVLIVAVIYILKKICSKNNKIFYRNKELLFFVFFILIASIIASRVDLHSIKQSILLIGTAIYAIYLVDFYEYEEVFNLIYKSQIIILIITIIFVIATPEYGLMYYKGELVWRGAFVHKNLLAANIAFNILLLFTIYKINNNKISRILKVINICISMVVLLLTGSKTSILIIIIAFGIYIIYKITKFKINVAYILILINLVVYNITDKQEQYSEIFIKLFKRDLTFTGRTEIWTVVRQVIEKNPLIGYGYNNIWIKDSQLTQYIRSAVGFNVTGSHNGFLEWMLEIGVLGLLILLYILILTGRRIIKIFNTNIFITKFSIQYLAYIIIFYITERASNPLSYQMLMLFIMITLVNDCYYKNFK